METGRPLTDFGTLTWEVVGSTLEWHFKGFEAGLKPKLGEIRLTGSYPVA